MDRYVSNACPKPPAQQRLPVRSHPMITYTGYPVSLNVPRGDFEEYEIEVDDSGEQRAVSVKGRPYGRTNPTSSSGSSAIRSRVRVSYRRVLVLSDATRDMGSLAEAECRRVIAALDLADEMGSAGRVGPDLLGRAYRHGERHREPRLDRRGAAAHHRVHAGGGEINIIVSGINVGAQSYWNAEATMLMHTRGLLIMTDDASMLLTGKKALDFSGQRLRRLERRDRRGRAHHGPNGQAQVWVQPRGGVPGCSSTTAIPTSLPASGDLAGSRPRYRRPGRRRRRLRRPARAGIRDDRRHLQRAVQPERKKPFDMRQLMYAVVDTTPATSSGGAS